MAKIYSQLEKAQLELLGADPTGTGLITGRVWYRSDTLKLKVYNGTITQEFVDLTSSQSLSNKSLNLPILLDAITMTQVAAPGNPSAGFNRFYARTDNMLYQLNSAGVEKVIIDGTSTQSMFNKTLDAPTISSAITGLQIATPAAPAAGYNKLYPKSDGKWYNQTPAGVETELGAGGGSGINYITFPSGDTGVGTWVISKNTSANAVPDNGFVTSGITGTFATTASTPHRGAASFLWTLGALGEQIYIPFTIDNEDKGKVLQGSLSYSVVSGTYADNIHAWVYDVTNAVFLQPAPYKLLNSGIIEKFGFEFQTSSSSTSYRLVLHQAVAGTPAVKLDTFSVGPQAKLYGSPITDPVQYTPTLNTGARSGTISYDKAFWWREGAYMNIRWDYKHTAAGTAGSGTYTFTLPTGYQIDTTRMGGTFATGAAGPVCGTWTYSATSNVGSGVIVMASATTLSAYFDEDATSTATSWTAAGNAGFGVTSLTFSLAARVPILGWASQSVSSSDSDTRVILAAVEGDPASATVGNPIIFPTKTYDTHGAYNATTGKYTVPVPGYYRVAGYLNTNTAAIQLTIEVNDVGLFNVGATDSAGECAFHGIVLCRAGDTIHISPSGTVDATNASQMTIEKLSGPSQIMASEKVEARYQSTSGQSIPNNTLTIIDFATKTFDTHGSVVTGASWKWTATRAGKARVVAKTLTVGSGWGTTETSTLQLYKNGSLWSYLHFFDNYLAQNQNAPNNGSDIVEVVAGDYLDIRMLHNNGASQPLSTTAGHNYVSITME